MRRFPILAAVTLFLSGCVTSDPATLSQRYEVEIYDRDKVFGGTTIFGDTSDPDNPVIVEVDMAGKVVWSYALSQALLRSSRAGGGMDVEWLRDRDSILICIRDSGIHEIDRTGKVVWSHWRKAVSHDVDRLPNGNTLGVWGWGDDSSDPEAFEIDPSGRVVWEWRAEPHLKGFTRHFPVEGLTHANAVVRLRNGNTLISLRNYYMLVEVDRAGNIVWKLENLFTTPHDPEELPSGNILVNTRGPQVIREYNRAGRVVWEHYPQDADTVRYNHRLPNGNVIFVERRKIVEITPAGEVVWQMRLKNVSTRESDKHRWLYKAERIPLRGDAALPLPPPTAKTVATPDPRGPMTRGRAVSSQMLDRFDRNRDGRLSKSEFRGGRVTFEDLDLDGDGYATAAEIERAVQTRGGGRRPGGGPPLQRGPGAGGAAH